jgi:hypothetical protein
MALSRFEELLQTRMTRKQFLRTLGAGLAVMCGLPTILHILNFPGSVNQVSGGYGASNYGSVEAEKLQHTFGKNN